MNDGAGWACLEQLAQLQWGLFTTAQARAAGIAAHRLARGVIQGQLIRVHHGVYEMVGTDEWTSFGDWAAQWLALRPDTDISSRRSHPESVVSHAAAAQLQRLGVITSPAIELTSPQRINLRNPRARTWLGETGIKGHDWHLVDGFPTTTPARTLTDLLSSHGDGGHIGTLILSGLADGRLQHNQVIDACDRAAHGWGHEPRDGKSLLESLVASATPPILDETRAFNVYSEPKVASNCKNLGGLQPDSRRDVAHVDCDT